MKTRKSSIQQQSRLYTVNGLSELTGTDRATVKRYLADVAPVKVDGASRYYALSDFEAAVNAKPDGGNLKDAKLREEIRKLRIANDQKERELVLRREVAAAIRKTLPEIPKILDQRLVQEAPTPEEKIRARKAIDECVKVIAGMESAWEI